MNSKVLLQEKTKKLDSGVTIYYGSMNSEKCDVISITGKGKYKANSKEVNYSDVLPQTKIFVSNKVSKYLSNNNDIGKHFIFTFDMTSNGVLYDKCYKFKYTTYIKPKLMQSIEKTNLWCAE